MADLPKTPVGLEGLEGLWPLVQGLFTLVLAVLGMIVVSIIGSLAYPVGGVGAILGLLIGGVVFGLIGCFMSGLWRQLFIGYRLPVLGSLLPQNVAAAMGSHGDFTLIVTIHEVKNLEVRGYLPWIMKPDIYVQIDCGKNPPKRTCVKRNCQYNEQFKLEVNAADDTIMLWVLDQDVFGSDKIGYVALNIQKDIIEAGFPARQRHVLEAQEDCNIQWAQGQASIIVSYDHTEDYAESLRPKEVRAHEVRREEEGEKRRLLETVPNARNYDAVKYLSQREYWTQKPIYEKESRPFFDAEA